MSAVEVAAVIVRVHDAMWLPRIRSWEIAESDGVWGAHGELAADDSVAAVMALTKLASETGSEFVDTGRLFSVSFVERDVPVRVWWLRPVVPVVHTTVPVLMTELAQSEHELTGARLALWEEEQDSRRLRLALKSARRGRAGARERVAELERSLAARAAERDIEIVQWLNKKAREYRSTGSQQHAKQAEAVELMASKLARGAVPTAGAGEAS